MMPSPILSDISAYTCVQWRDTQIGCGLRAGAPAVNTKGSPRTKKVILTWSTIFHMTWNLKPLIRLAEFGKNRRQAMSHQMTMTAAEKVRKREPAHDGKDSPAAGVKKK